MSEQKPESVFLSPKTAAGSSDPLRDTYQQLEHAEQLRQQGQIDRARTICEGLVGRYPTYFGALYTLGLIYLDKKQYPQALGCLVRAAMLNPRNWRALTALSAVYLELGASEMAAHTLEQAIQLQPENPDILLTLGEIYRQEKEYELAREAYRKSFALDNRLSASAIGFSICCAHLGQYAEAAAALKGLIEHGAASLEVLSELIALPAQFVSIDLEPTFKKIVAQSGKKLDESVRSFVAAELLDRAGKSTEAWQQLIAANRAIFPRMQREAESLAITQQDNIAQLRDKRIDVCVAPQGTGTTSLFILGPSRSGKTTMETLVAALDGVKRGYENPSVENAIVRAFQNAGLLSHTLFEVLPPKLDTDCRTFYLEELAKRAGSAKVFTNTHPARIHDVARVAAAFPRVRFIFVKRDLDDNMLRIFMQRYQSGNAYAYDLKSIRAHLIWYQDMIDMFAKKLPEIARVIRYEDMVADPAAAANVAAELCGLQMTSGPLPAIGDDRGCAKPYLEMMRKVAEI